MANKNQKRIAALARKDARSGNQSLSLSIPSAGYHNQAKGQFAPRTIPLLKGQDSPSRGRNMVQRTLANTGADGKKFSVTVHEPADKQDKFRPFLRHKLRADENGRPLGLGNPHPWVWAHEKSGNYARPSIG